MTLLATVAASLARPSTRSPLRPHYKPAALLSVLELLDEGAVDPVRMDAASVVNRLTAVFADFDPAHQAQVFQPLWHLRTNGAWSLLDANGAVLEGPEWGNYDKRPKSLTAFRRLVKFIAPTAPASWADPDERATARGITLQLLLDDSAPVSRAIATYFAAEAQGASVSEEDWKEDLRRKAWAQIVVRRGQARFRRALLAAYDGRCAISGCDATAVLEAAHISRYRGAQTDKPANGLLLRADLHTLFDLHLLSIDPEARIVWIAPALRGGEYGGFHGRPAYFPGARGDQPNSLALSEHLDEARAQSPDVAISTRAADVNAELSAP